MYIDIDIHIFILCIIDQARGQDGCILAKFSFCVFMDRDELHRTSLVNKGFIIWHKEHTEK